MISETCGTLQLAFTVERSPGWSFYLLFLACTKIINIMSALFPKVLFYFSNLFSCFQCLGDKVWLVAQAVFLLCLRFPMKVCPAIPGSRISHLKNDSVFLIPFHVSCGIVCYLRFSCFTDLGIKVYFRLLPRVAQKSQYISLGSSKFFKGLESSRWRLSFSASSFILIWVSALTVL